MMKRVFWPSVLMFVVLAGCRSDLHPVPPLHPVTGMVVNKGVPVKGGSVHFNLVDNPAPYVIDGVVKDDGRFELTTMKGTKPYSGAPEGKYKVMYTAPGDGQSVTAPRIAAATYEVVANKNNELVVDVGAKE